MEIREGSRSRNNKLIFITAGVILMLIILSLQTQPESKIVTINIGDSSYQVANMLTGEGIAFSVLMSERGEGIIVEYTPVTSFERLNKKKTGSQYEIYFAEGQVSRIVWRSKDKEKSTDLLFVKVAARQ